MTINIRKIALSLFVVLLGVSMFVSCNDEQETTKGDITKSSSRERSRIFEQNISTRTFAKSLAETILRSPNVLSEIHAGVQEVVNYGLDENLTVFDVLNTTNSKFIRNTNFRILPSAFNRDSLSVLGLLPENYYMDLNIYWGYHDNWNGRDIPVICYVDENTTDSITGAFWIRNGEIIEATMTAALFDSETIPAIIINFNDIKYAKYPNFRGGEWDKDGLSWAHGSNSESDTADRSTNVWTDSTKIYKAKMVYFQSGGYQWDPWVCGGSEFKVSAGYTTSTTSTTVSTQMVHFKRKSIKERKTKIISNIIHHDWQKESENGAISVVEEDWGWNDDIRVSLKFKNISLEVSLPKLSNDDIVGVLGDLKRVSFINDYINGDNYYGFSDCTIKTIIKVSDRPY
jgi:hypothetical protein